VYVAGYIGEYHKQTACYWKDNGASITRIDLYHGLSEATDIAIDDAGNVYIAGYIYTGETYAHRNVGATEYLPRAIACYWIDDGTTITRKDIPDSFNAISITLNSGNIYILGESLTYYHTINNIDHYSRVRCYWKISGNNITTIPFVNIENDFPYSYGAYYNLYNIAIDSSSNVYISGTYSYTDGNYSNPNYREYKAFYWKNDGMKTTQTILYGVNSSASTIAYDMAIDDFDNVYVVGYYWDIPCYWKNGVRTDLSGGTSATSIVIDSGNVYIAGIYESRYSSSGSYPPCYWVNGEYTEISFYSTYPYGYSIAVNSGDIYLAGSTNYYNASYWRPFQFLSSIEHVPRKLDENISYANAIVVR
jgi:hypothetical protein